MGRIPGGGSWRAHGPNNHVRGRGFDYVDALVNDCSRLAYSEILPGGKGARPATVLLRSTADFASYGIGHRQDYPEQPTVMNLSAE